MAMQKKIKTQHTMGLDKHMGTNISLVKQLGLSILTLNIIVKICHVPKENANQCGRYQITF
jgi:hypothetical protein